MNTNTVLRALRLLRDEGLLEFRRGRGIHVASGRYAVPKSAVLTKAHELVELARREGYRSDDLIQADRRPRLSPPSATWQWLPLRSVADLEQPLRSNCVQ